MLKLEALRCIGRRENPWDADTDIFACRTSIHPQAHKHVLCNLRNTANSPKTVYRCRPVPNCGIEIFESKCESLRWSWHRKCIATSICGPMNGPFQTKQDTTNGSTQRPLSPGCRNHRLQNRASRSFRKSEIWKDDAPKFLAISLSEMHCCHHCTTVDHGTFFPICINLLH
jgi:hypothetical protein